MAGIAVVVEHFEGRIRPVTYELLACAAELQGTTTAPIQLILIGCGIEELAGELAEETGVAVDAIEVPGVTTYNAEVYKGVLHEVLSEMDFSLCCVAHSTQGLDFAPGLAVRLDAACVTGVERIEGGKDGLKYTRAISGGKVSVILEATTPRVILTIQPGSFPVCGRLSATTGHMNLQTVDWKPSATRNREIKPAEDDNSALSEASVIVAAGRGVGTVEGLALVESLVGIFAKSVIGGSRPLCDLGWLSYGQQIGITGATVSPDLYIACGISGASQHVAGMRGSGVIVAINRDPNAAIFNLSDLCIVEDLTSFIPILINAYRKMRD